MALVAVNRALHSGATGFCLLWSLRQGFSYITYITYITGTHSIVEAGGLELMGSSSFSLLSAEITGWSYPVPLSFRFCLILSVSISCWLPTREVADSLD